MARTLELRVPKLGNYSDVPVVEIFMAEGNAIAKNDPVVSLESEKAVIEVPSPESGKVLSVKVKQGDKVSEGDLLGTMELAGDKTETGEGRPHPEAGPDVGPDPDPQTLPGGSPGPGSPEPVPGSEIGRALPDRTGDQGRVEGADSADVVVVDTMTAFVPGTYHASPSVRLFARELGADLAFVKGTGPKGRVRQADVAAYVKASLGAVQNGSAGAAGAVGGTVGGTAVAGSPAAGDVSLILRKPAPVDLQAFRKFGEVEIVPASRIKRISGPRLAESWQTIPHVTQFDEVDITEFEGLRVRFNKHLEAEGIKLTALAFAIRASVATLKVFPLFNSSLLADSGEFAVKKYYNIGFAVSTDAGLVVPSIKNADRKSLREIGKELRELSARAEAGKLTLEDMSGATFTISSLGSIGGTAFTPIINPPEVAIMGLSRAVMKPVWDEKSGSFIPRLVLPFSLSYDHRAIDGAEGARFCRHFASLMGDPAALLV